MLRIWSVLSTLVLIAVATVLTAPEAVAAAQHNWTSYLGGARHPSYTTNAQISKAAAAQLKLAWKWKPADASPVPGAPTNGMFSSPTVYNHRIYVGAYNGYLYALSESTGTVLWKRFIGIAPSRSCVQPLGVVSTPAVAAVPNASGTGTTPVVYVAGPDGYLYALDGITGAIRWKSVVVIPSTTVNDAFNWSSPTIVGGRIYLGFASNCDRPWIRGGVMSFDQNTGNRLATWYGVPAGSIGGGVWSSAAVTSDAVFVTTGSTCSGGSPSSSGCTSTNQAGDSYSIVRLDPVTLAKKAAWKVPAAELTLAGDPDWGSSPVIFNATVNGATTRLVGACHKNGFFYAVPTAALKGPMWKVQVGSPTSDGGSACLAAAIYDGSRLFLPSNKTTIGGTSYAGSLRRVDPSTGAIVWQRGLADGNVLGSPSENGAGVIAVPTHKVGATTPNNTFLLDADTGSVLATIPNGSEFAQPSFADQYLLLTSSYANTLYAYTP